MISWPSWWLFTLLPRHVLRRQVVLVVCVGPNGSGTYIDVAFQAFDDMFFESFGVSSH
ncbi:hypothetical protein Scep_010459 [Stephania cephalantha]|uniref:Secreted protein n=1 Tax=Stephania cephalantha TaxID=152367 RepID=A0AAP0JWD5_9MAGN